MTTTSFSIHPQPNTMNDDGMEIDLDVKWHEKTIAAIGATVRSIVFAVERFEAYDDDWCDDDVSLDASADQIQWFILVPKTI